MLAKAKEMMQKFGAEFIVTGEVLGQRPMSQHRKSLGIIAEESGLGGLLLRPLSARLLTPTIPEKMGWVRRDELCDFCGLTRRRQIELASVLGVRDYPNPSGGCLLTDAGFSQRVKDLIAKSELSLKNIELLKVGRHFRIAPHAKLVVGRNEEENRELENLAQEGDYLFFPAPEQAGATALGRGTFDQCFIYLACAITCRYFDLDDSQRAQILYKRIPEEGERTLSASPLSEKELQGLRI
jgi:tRNA U34 2-thiouridine synthase MnmA/TrmU